MSCTCYKECCASSSSPWHSTQAYLVAILEEDVMECVEMKGVTIGECAVHIEEDCLDCAQIGEWSVSGVSAHCNSSDLDGLCRSSVARHDETARCLDALTLWLRNQCIRHGK